MVPLTALDLDHIPPMQVGQSVRAFVVNRGPLLTLAINPPCQYTLSTQPVNTPCQHTLSIHILTIHTLSIQTLSTHTLSIHPINRPALD